jgi:hypothetical protein
MTDCYEARLVDARPYFDTVLQVRIFLASSLSNVEMLRLPKRLKSHQLSVNGAGDTHNLCRVSPMAQNKAFRNVAGSLVNGGP